MKKIIVGIFLVLVLTSCGESKNEELKKYGNIYLSGIENKLNKIEKEGWFYNKSNKIKVLDNTFVDNKWLNNNSYFCNKNNNCIGILWDVEKNENESIYSFYSGAKDRLDPNKDYLNFIWNSINIYKKNPLFKNEYNTLDDYLEGVTEYQLASFNSSYYGDIFYLSKDKKKEFNLNKCKKIDFNNTWIKVVNEYIDSKYWIYSINDKNYIEKLDNLLKKEHKDYIIDYVIYDLDTKINIIYNCYKDDIANKTLLLSYNPLFFIKTEKKLYILHSYWIDRLWFKSPLLKWLSNDKLLKIIWLK